MTTLLPIEREVRIRANVCFGLYKDDIDDVTGLVLAEHDWIQCSEEDYGVWSHVKCLEECVMVATCVQFVSVIIQLNQYYNACKKLMLQLQLLIFLLQNLSCLSFVIIIGNRLFTEQIMW